MKSKPSFTKAETEEIICFIKEKLKSEPSKQKGIRDKIRKIGFYASDYGFRDGFTVEEFLSVAKITGGILHKPALQEKPSSIIKQTVQKTTTSQENWH